MRKTQVRCPDCKGESLLARVTGNDLIKLGFKPGPWFKPALQHVNRAGLNGAKLLDYLNNAAPKEIPALELHAQPVPCDFFIESETPDEQSNIESVRATMSELLRTPTAARGYVMPDACPAGPMGSIPVGGVAVAKNAIHPGWHSADICCSVMLSNMGNQDPKTVLDAAHAVTHFGGGGREPERRVKPPQDIIERGKANQFLSDPVIITAMTEHFGTQGDGNHFLFVGNSTLSGDTCLVTHHGSRKPGAMLYKAGMKAAIEHCKKRAPTTPRFNTWIPADTAAGREYWEALQIIRAWTKANHQIIHKMTANRVGAEIEYQCWNEHNFVFERHGEYYHAKGATPLSAEFLPDSDEKSLQLIPLNMAEPVLVVTAKAQGCGWAPHGAGRNISRTEHRRRQQGTDEETFARETADIDARFYSGRTDTSELPSAYKSAAAVRAQIDRHGLCEIVDEIQPYGSIMAGDWQVDSPWRKKGVPKGVH